MLATLAQATVETPPIDWHALAPEIVVTLTLCAVLVIDLLLPERLRWLAAPVSSFGLLAAFFPVLTLAVSESGTRSLFGDSFVVDDFSLLFKGLFLGIGYVVLMLSLNYFEEGRYYQGEYYALLLSSIVGALVMASARDLVSMYLGLELLSQPAYLMAGWRKGDARSNEAALKYFLLGVLSSAVLLFGMSIVFGLSGSLQFTAIADAAAAQSLGDVPAYVIGVCMVLVGFAFKVSAVPFHFWAPDTYEGAPTPVTAYLSTASKAAGFVGLMTLCFKAFAPNVDVWGPLLYILAIATVVVGNFTALRQSNIVRLLAYSSVAQAGFILGPLAMARFVDESDWPQLISAASVYLLIYAVMNLGAFATVIAGARRTRSGDVAAFAGLFSYAPVLAVLMSLFFFSLAGIPPLAGWFAKLQMFRAVFIDAGAAGVTMGVILALASVIALFYYARVGGSVISSDVPESLAPASATRELVPAPLRLALAMTIIGVIAVGVYPQLFAFLADRVSSF